MIKQRNSKWNTFTKVHVIVMTKHITQITFRTNESHNILHRYEQYKTTDGLVYVVLYLLLLYNTKSEAKEKK